MTKLTKTLNNYYKYAQWYREKHEDEEESKNYKNGNIGLIKSKTVSEMKFSLMGLIAD